MIKLENRDFCVKMSKPEQLAHLTRILAGEPSVCKGCGEGKEAAAFRLPGERYPSLELCFEYCWQKATVGRDKWCRERREEKKLKQKVKARFKYVERS